MMDSSCHCRRVWKLVLFLVGVTSISAISILLYDTIATLMGAVSVCTLWLDIAGRFSLLVTGYYVAGLCGCLPFPDIFRPEWFPEPFSVWKLCTRCSGYPDNIARMFRICTCRTRTSSRDLLLENPPYYPGVPQWGSTRSVASPVWASSRPDPPSDRCTKSPLPELRIFRFDGSLASDDPEPYLEESCEPAAPPTYDERRSNRPRHPRVPWRMLRLDRTWNRWPTDADGINRLLDPYFDPSPVDRGEEDLVEGEKLACRVCGRSRKNIRKSSVLGKCTRHVRRRIMHGRKELDPTGERRIADHSNSKGSRKKRILQKTTSKLEKGKGIAMDYESMRSVRLPDLSPKATSKSNTDEGAAISPGEPGPTSTERFLDSSDLKRVSGASEKSPISTKTFFRLDINEGAAVGVYREHQQIPVSNPYLPVGEDGCDGSVRD